MRVKRLVEKPLNPASKSAIMPVYVFDSNIFKALETTKAGFAGELQFTDGIQKTVDWGPNVFSTRVESSEVWLDLRSQISTGRHRTRPTNISRMNPNRLRWPAAQLVWLRFLVTNLRPRRQGLDFESTFLGESTFDT